MTPLSLRIARLALVAAAAAALGALAYIVALARVFSAPLAGFALGAVLFLLAARSIAADARRGRLLAVGGALVLAGVGVLAGFGAGNITLPAASLGVLAAWAALLHPPRRPMVIAFAAYIALGVALLLARGAALFAFPWLLSGAVLWPWTSALFSPAVSALPIFASIGSGAALGAAAFVRPERRPIGPLTIAVAASAGVAALALWVAYAFARADTSRRFELEAAPLLVVFAAAALMAFGVPALHRNYAAGLAALTIGAALAALVLFSRPVVECTRGGTATGSGPWWLPSGGSTVASGPASISATISGPTSAGTATGRIERGDLVMTYSCQGSEVTDFRMERR